MTGSGQDVLVKLCIDRLQLTNFRNYAMLAVDFDNGPVVLTGANGAGKTNILEAISFFSPGKGLRQLPRMDLADCRHATDDDMPTSWVVSADVHGIQGTMQIGTGRDKTPDSNKRLLRVDGKNVTSQSLLSHIFSVMWLTPQMDGLFLQGASERRKFLDRMVCHFYPEHASHLYSYEYSMKERSKLLQERADPAWLTVLEQKMAERAVSIAAGRRETLSILQETVNEAPSHFPKAILKGEGLLETLLETQNALEVEERFLKVLHESRQFDAMTKRTRYGPHRSDMQVIHGIKHMSAASCSTGEQKALLLSIILAEARAKMKWRRTIPVLLLDEVVAHLDERRRQGLFEELLDMKCQVFMTGTDELLFASVGGNAQFLAVNEGRVKYGSYVGNYS